MTVLDLPKRSHPDFAIPGKAPLGPVAVDWQNPLSRGLIGVWRFAGASRYLDLVGSNHAQLILGAEPQGDHTETFKTGTKYIKIDDPDSIYSDDSAGCTVTIRGGFVSGNIFDRLCTKNGNTTPTSPGWHIYSGGDPDSYGARGDSGTLSWDSGESIYGKDRWFTFRSDGTNVAFWVDGVSRDGTAGFMGTPTTIPITLGFYENESPGNDADAFFKDLVIHGRALSDDEIQALHTDPYQILRPAVPLQLFIGGGGTNIELASIIGLARPWMVPVGYEQ